MTETDTVVDYAAQMRALIDEHTAEGPYVPRVAASEIVEKLRATNPKLLAGWLDEQAECFVWQAINDRDRSRRSRVAHTARREVFHQASEKHQAGDRGALVGFLQVPYSVEDGRRLTLGQLRKPDLIFVADDYERRARENTMWSTFMRALAKKVGKGTVSDHFTDQQLTEMFRSIQG